MAKSAKVVRGLRRRRRRRRRALVSFETAFVREEDEGIELKMHFYSCLLLLPLAPADKCRVAFLALIFPGGRILLHVSSILVARSIWGTKLLSRKLRATILRTYTGCVIR